MNRPPRKLKILYTNAMYAPDIGGGAEIILKGMAEGMLARGHDVHALVTHPGQGDLEDSVAGVTVHRLKLRNIYWPLTTPNPSLLQKTIWHGLDSANPLMASAIRTALREIKPDVIVSNNLPGLSVALWKEAQTLGIPVVQVLHDYYLICPRSTMFKNGCTCQQQCRSCAIFRSAHKALSDQVAAVIGVSQAILKTHLDRGLFEHTPIKEVIYNARILQTPDGHQRQQHASTTFGFIGALTEVKGIQELVKAFMSLASESADVRLLVGGTGKPEFTAELQKLTAGDSRVIFLGHVNPEQFFQQIDVCVVPSIWNDPLPGVTYEALSQGVPVIGSSLGGIPEIIGPAHNGIVFNPREPGALLSALKRYLATKSSFSPQVDARFTDPTAMLDRHEAVLRSTLPTG